MAYIIIDNFRLGVDRSRPIYAAEHGTMWAGINGHLSRGGDFEKRKAFVEKYSLPVGTKGLASAKGRLYVFGSTSTPAGIPSDITYQQLEHPDGVMELSRIVWVELFNGLPYVIAEFADGSTFHYYNGTRVSDWDDGLVLVMDTDNTGIATRMKNLVNAQGGGDFTATSVGAVVTVTKTAGNFSAADSVQASTLNKTGGVDDQTATVNYAHPAATATITIGGTFEAGDRFNIKLETQNFGFEGNPTVIGRVAKTLGRKVYAAGENLLSFSGVDTAIGWTENVDTGAGQINMSNHLAGAETIAALAAYQGRLAGLSRAVIQIWTVDADPDNNAQEQVIEGTGTRAPGSVRSFGDLDVFYLSDSGVRSLRARDLANVAGVNDVGTPIDSLIREFVNTLTDLQIESAVSVVEPLDGRYWLAMGTRIFVFTYFPSKKISAWSWYEPGFTIDAFAVINAKVYVRSGDTIYLHGGDSGQEYDANTEVTAWLPFLTAAKEGHFKQISGIAIAATGVWNCRLLVDPNDMAVEEEIGDLEGVTFSEESNAHVGHHTHIAPKLVHNAAGFASLSKIALYYQGADSDGGTR